MPDDLSGLNREFDSRLKEYIAERRNEKEQLKEELYTTFGINPKSLLAERIALFLTAKWELR